MKDPWTCEECNRKNTSFEWCKVCNAKHFQQNFENWTSGNDNIDKFIIITSQIIYRTMDDVLCKECNQKNTGLDWCKACNAKHFQQNFEKWTRRSAINK